MQPHSRFFHYALRLVSVYLRSSILIRFTFLLTLLTAHCSAPHARAQSVVGDVSVSFRGPDTIHLSYDVKSTAPTTVRVDLFIQSGNGQRQRLDSGSTQIKGTKRLTGLTVGSHRISTDIVVRNANGVEFTNGGPFAYAELAAGTYSGTLLYDEACAGGTSPGKINVSVPQGRSLTLDGFIKGTGASLSGGGNVTLNNSHFTGLRLPTNGVALLSAVSVDGPFLIPSKLKATIDGSYFRSTQATVIEGTSNVSETAPVQIQNCEFYAGINVAPRNVRLENSMILRTVRFVGPGWNNAPSSMVVQGNSLLGVSALEYSDEPLTSKIAIGANYYGDLKGPNTWDFGGGRGGLVDIKTFALPDVSSKSNKLAFKQAFQNRKFPSQADIPPDIGLVGIRLGQNTLTSENNYYIRQGRPFLVSVDLSTSWKRLDGVQVYAELNGARYDPVRQVPLYRDLFDNSGNSKLADVAAGETTFNIILPAPSTNRASLKIFMDTRGVAAIPNGVLLPLFSRDLDIRPAPARKFNIGVVPVRIGVRGYPTNTPSALVQAQTLQSFLPAMLPLRSDEISVVTDPAITYDASDAGWFDSWAVTSLCYTLTEYLENYMDEFNSLAEPKQRLDRLIGVIPDGTLGAEGVNVMTSRRVALVEEAKPLAAIHELGHSFGLYTRTEQYDLPGYPNGYPVASATVFLPEPGLDLTSFAGYARFGRIHHINRNLGELAYDVMGNTDPAWLVQSTLSSFGQQLENLLRNPIGPTASARAAVTLQSLPDVGKRRIYVRGAYARIGNPWPWDTNILNYTFIRDTVTALDVTTLNKSPLKPFNAGKANRVQFQPFDTNGFAVWAETAYVNFDNPASRPSPLSYCAQTFDISTNVAGFDIVDIDGPIGQIAGGPVLTVDSRRRPVIRLISPVSGQTIADTLVVQVSALAGTNSIPLSHVLFFSTNNGAAWTQVGGIRRGNRHELNSDSLPSGQTLSLKVISGDAFNTVENRVDNLRVQNRAPRVLLLSPSQDEQGSTGRDWLLQARVSDVEDGLITSGQWTSSVDGNLGSGSTLAGVRLSAGSHELIFKATDSQGAAAESRVRVQVKATDPSTSDLQLTAASLLLVPAGASRAMARLTVNQTNHLAFDVLNRGAQVEALLRVSLQLLGGSTSQIAEVPLTVPDFGNARGSAWYVPTVEGDYVVRAEIVNADPADSDSSNNQASWTLPALNPGIRVNIQPPEAVAAGAQWRLDNEAWQDSGAKVLGTSLRNLPEHLVNCKQIPGWFTPPAQYLLHHPLEPVSLIMVYRRNLGNPPWFATQPKSQSVNAGTNVTLRVSVSGTPTPVLQWYRDGAALAGATNTSLRLTNVQPAHAGVYTVIATNAAGVVASEPAVLNVLFSGANFASWATAQKLSANANGPADDPDQDGFPNILEYALALNPLAPDSRNTLPKPALIQTNGQTYLSYTYRRPKVAPSDLTYQVTASASVSPWQSSTAGLETGAPVDKGEYVEVTVKAIIPPTGNSSGFIQFKVIKNSP